MPGASYNFDDCEWTVVPDAGPVSASALSTGPAVVTSTLRCLSNDIASRNWVLPDEAQRAARFLHQGARERFLAGRTLLRMAATRVLDMPVEMLALAESSHGKPSFAHASASRLSFNISHTDSHVGVVLSLNGGVGLDLELPRPVSHMSDVGRRLLAPAEMAEAVGRLDDEQFFFALWTRKEAVVKLLGGRLLVDALSFSVLDSCGWINSPQVARAEQGAVRVVGFSMPSFAGACVGAVAASQSPSAFYFVSSV